MSLSLKPIHLLLVSRRTLNVFWPIDKSQIFCPSKVCSTIDRPTSTAFRKLFAAFVLNLHLCVYVIFTLISTLWRKNNNNIVIVMFRCNVFEFRALVVDNYKHIFCRLSLNITLNTVFNYEIEYVLR